MLSQEEGEDDALDEEGEREDMLAELRYLNLSSDEKLPLLLKGMRRLDEENNPGEGKRRKSRRSPGSMQYGLQQDVEDDLEASLVGDEEEQDADEMAAQASLAGAAFEKQQDKREEEEDRVRLAALLVLDCLSGHTVEKPGPSKLARQCHDAHVLLLPVFRVVVVGLIALSLYELPHWCLQQEVLDGLEITGTCPGSQTEGTLNWRARYLTPRESAVIEGFGLLILTLDALLVYIAYGYWRHAAFIGPSLLDLAISLVWPAYWHAGRYLRPCFASLYNRELRFYLRLVVTIMPEFVNIAFVVGLFILFCGWYGTVLTTGEESEQYFPNLVDGSWNLLVGMTTANFPDVMLPAYLQQRASAAPFLFFMIIATFFLINLVLASVYDKFQTSHERRLESQAQKRSEAEARIFMLLQDADGDEGGHEGDQGGGGQEGVGSSGQQQQQQQQQEEKEEEEEEKKRDRGEDKEQLQQWPEGEGAAQPQESEQGRQGNVKGVSVQMLDRLLHTINHYNEVAHSHVHVSKITDEQMYILRLVVPEGQQYVDENTLSAMLSLLLLRFVKVKGHEPTFMALWLPDVYHHRCFASVRAAVLSPYFEWGIDVCLILNAVVVFLQNSDRLSGAIIDSKLLRRVEAWQSLFSFVYVIEMLLKMAVLGWKNYVRRPKNVFDGAITVACCFSGVSQLLSSSYDGTKVRHFLILRMLRLARLIVQVPTMRVIIRTLARVVPDAATFLVLLYLVMHVYALMGVDMFGGLITLDPSDPKHEALVGSDYDGSDYWPVNFNDHTSGIVSLFVLLCMNNWHAIVEAFVLVTGSKWTRWWFISYYMLAGLVVTNIVIAVLLDAFLREYKRGARTEHPLISVFRGSNGLSESRGSQGSQESEQEDEDYTVEVSKAVDWMERDGMLQRMMAGAAELRQMKEAVEEGDSAARLARSESGVSQGAGPRSISGSRASMSHVLFDTPFSRKVSLKSSPYDL